MITREIDYAIRALLYLAMQEDGRVVSTTVLAETMEIPYRFLRRILLTLGEAGLVESQRGKQGGLRLARDPKGVTLLDVVQAVDPNAVSLNLCLRDPEACRRTPLCTVHEALVEVQAHLNDELAALTLADLAARERAKRA